ncbi:CbtB domain-containing protein [Pseudomonas fluorescens]|uniref:CbtB domain-containing protein n=1 Tax=Pseudomonas fluorescens TaxID=294 RepID=UPI00123F79B6|nr:CbtB domain-containing protein [Pseudomonas fluorescens]VVN43759.1 hypothetical protein PS676_05560 [Pseudomonas fluorescens]
MTTNTASPGDIGSSIPTIPLGEILPWAIFGGLLLMLGIYFIGAEQGATSIFSGTFVHEYVHDSRHLLGFPCH